MSTEDLRTRAQMLEDLDRMRDRIAVLAAERDSLRNEADEWKMAAGAEADHADRLAAELRESRARIAELEGGGEVARPEMCATLSECTGNRAAAEKVSRVVS